MKKLTFPTLIILFIATLSSCVVLSPKKYNALLSQRDSLSLGWEGARTQIASLEEQVASLKSDTASLNGRIASLEGKVEGMDANLNSLRSNSSTEIRNLAADLQKREARLKEVEEILRKRDEATNALKNKLQKALLGFQQNGLTVDIRNGKVYVSLTDKLLFGSGSIVIDEKGKLALQELATVLKTQP